MNEGALLQAARRESRLFLALCSPAYLLVGVVLFIPIGWLFWLSLIGPEGQFTFDNYARMFRRSYLNTFYTTFEVSLLVTFACIVMGYPLSYLLSQLKGRAAGIGLSLVLLPFWTSLLVRTYAWLVLLQRKGVINSWLLETGLIEKPIRLVHNMTGTVIGMTHIMLPFLVLPLYAAMKTIRHDYMRAASNCGATPTQAFWQIFFPLSLPGLSAGVTLVFVMSLGFYVTPALLGGGKVMMWAMRIEKTVTHYSHWGAASALGIALLVVTFMVLYLLNKLFHLDDIYGEE